MDKLLKYYLDNGTQRLIELLSESSVDEEERKEIIKNYVSAIRNNIINKGALPDGELLIDTISLNYVDKRILDYSNIQKISLVQCDKALALCERLKGIVVKFEERGWEIPFLRNNDIDRMVIAFNEKKAGIGIQDRIKELDGVITNLISQARTELSVTMCNSALERVEELKTQMVECKNKGVSVPQIKNSDTEICIKEIDTIKELSERKSDLIKQIYETDMQIDALVTSQLHLLQDKWDELEQLCKKQNNLFADCKSNKWSVPEVKNNQLEKIEEQISIYQVMINLDTTITSLEADLTSKQNYNSFIEGCTKQANNISYCRKNGWGIPNLIHFDPYTNAENARKNREKAEKAKAIKRGFRLFVAAVIAVFILVVFCVFKYRQGKVQIPFDSGWADGKELERVYDELDDAGFDNIELVADTTGWSRSDVVLGVTIDGQSNYVGGKYKKTDVRIVITYISSGRIDAEALLDGWSNDDPDILYAKLENGGFTNINVNEVYTTDSAQDRTIKDIYLNNVVNPYIEGECYIPSDANITINYYRYMVKIFSSLDGLLGRDDIELKNEFVAAGFTDVRVEDVKGYENWLPGGAVVDVVIDGNTDFADGDLVDPNTSVKIYYNNFARTDITDILENWETKSWPTVRDQLHKIGMTNVECSPVITDDPSENMLVRTIEIFGKQFPGGKCFVEPTATIKISYNFLRIRMNQPASYFAGNNYLNYQDVKKEFEDMGFVNFVLKRSDDLTTGWVNNEGTIKSITIGDQSDFSSGDMFDYNQRVTIVVYTFKGKGCEDISLKE